MVKYGKSRFFWIGFSLKFLSNADLVLQLHLEREVFWLFIEFFGTLAFTYLVKLHYRMIVR
jgi:hypothetical protein